MDYFLAALTLRTPSRRPSVGNPVCVCIVVWGFYLKYKINRLCKNNLSPSSLMTHKKCGKACSSAATFFFSNITTLRIQKQCIPPQRPNNPAMIKPIPLSHKLYLSPLDLDFYLDLQQFVLTGKYQPSRCSWLKKKVKISALNRNENALAPFLCSDPHQKNCRPILHSSFVNICLLVFV